MKRERRLQFSVYLPMEVVKAVEKLSKEEDLSRYHIFARLIRKGLALEAKERGVK